MFKSKKSSDSWRKIIQTYEQSNLSKSKFCFENKLQVTQFYYWCNKLRPDLKGDVNIDESKHLAFLPVKTSIEKNKSFSVNLKNGLKISFDSTPEASWVANLINSIDNFHDQY